MSENWHQAMMEDVARWVRTWHNLFLLGVFTAALNLGVAASNLLDSWSRDEFWWYFIWGLIQVVMGAFIVPSAVNSWRRWRCYQRLQYNLQRLEAANEVLYLTTSPALAALDQVMASFAELKDL